MPCGNPSLAEYGGRKSQSFQAKKGRTWFLAPDEVATGRAAVNYLVQMGHRRIMHVTYSRAARGIRDRAKGYEKAMRAHGQIPRVMAPLDEARLISGIRRNRITALFCHNDWLALAAIRSLGRAGLKVPEDVSVLGVDNSPTFTALCPDITTLQYPAAEIALLCRRLLRFETPSLRIGRWRLIERRTVIRL